MRNGKIGRFAALAISLCLSTMMLGALGGWSGPAPGNRADSDAEGRLPDLSKRAPQDEIIYFVLPDRFANGDSTNDRGGLTGDRMTTGFDPTDPGFYQGGDLKGLTAKLDYIQSLGATAIWLGPIYKNKPVQGDAKDASAGYHGYWITDFLAVDPHFGTESEMKAFVEAAHGRGMKVYLDIILNHTADVIEYAECPRDQPGAKVRLTCPYRSIADYPWTKRGGLNGPSINPGFLGVGAADANRENFARLTDSTYAYTPRVPKGEETIKNPAWLNDIRYYHNRGDTTFSGENSQYGDFNGLDDLMTEDPVVVQGMIDIFKHWITKYRIDGFRIDTIKHARPDLWRAFLPAIAAHARKEGIDNFYMFGEAYDFNPAALARFTREDRFPAVLDFAFQGAVRGLIADGKPARDFDSLFAADSLYAFGSSTAATLPTFLSNHDMGRMATFIRQAKPDISESEFLARLKLANAAMMFSRGVPVIYSGDEQGFNSDSNDRHARETLFASQVRSWNDNDLIGSNATTAQDNYDTNHPLFTAIAGMAALRKANAPLRRGLQIIRHSDEKGGLLVFSRLDPLSGEEIVIALNAEKQPRSVNVMVESGSLVWTTLHGACAPAANAPTSYSLSVGPLDYVICRSKRDSAQ